MITDHANNSSPCGDYSTTLVTNQNTIIKSTILNFPEKFVDDIHVLEQVC